MPTYLVHARQFRMQNMAEITGAAYLSAAIIGVICGWISDRWLTKGRSPTIVRKTFTAAGMAVAAAALLGCVSASPGIVIAMVILATIGYGICSSNLWAITQTLAGPHAAGRWTGVQNFMGNLAGVIAPSVTGYIVKRTGDFYLAFVIAAVMCALGALSWVFFVGKVRPVEWKSALASEILPM
jgi:MFS family permease